MRRFIFLAMAALTTVGLLVSTTPAAASSSINLYGSGNGHGIGMSQWGAYGLASQGWSHRQILTHFYSGTRVQSDIKLPTKVRVGLAVDERSVQLTAAHGSVRLWVGSPRGTEVGKIREGDTWTVSPTDDGSYRVRDQDGVSVGGQRWGSPTQGLVVTYAGTDSRVQVPEAGGYTYAHGSLRFDTYGCSTRCLERVVLKIAFEQYLLGIAEVPSSWPRQALDAQAVASRTYAAYTMLHYGLRSGCGCDLSDGGNDQTYVGWSKESGTDGDRWVKAVTDTEDQVVTYQGEVIQAFFASSDGGYSENVEDAWHGGDPRYAVPYLRGVCDPGEESSPWVSWTRTFSASDATSRLRPYTGDIGTITGFTDDSRGVSGRIISVVARGASGHSTITGAQIRAAFGLPDDRVWFDKDKNITGAIRVAYDGLDCRPGMPRSVQLTLPDGSRQRFDRGGIYINTTADVTVWIRGVIYDEYRAVGEVMGVLGLPASDVELITDGGCDRCRLVIFDTGRIYLNPDTGTYALWGPVLTAYLNADGPAGSLGYPTGSVKVEGDGSSSAAFEHGIISCTSGGACTTT